MVYKKTGRPVGRPPKHTRKACSPIMGHTGFTRKPVYLTAKHGVYSLRRRRRA